MSGVLKEFHSIYFALIIAVLILVLVTHPTGTIGAGRTLFKGLTDPLFIIQGKTPPNYGTAYATKTGGV